MNLKLIYNLFFDNGHLHIWVTPHIIHQMLPKPIRRCKSIPKSPPTIMFWVQFLHHTSIFIFHLSTIKLKRTTIYAFYSYPYFVIFFTLYWNPFENRVEFDSILGILFGGKLHLKFKVHLKEGF